MSTQSYPCPSCGFLVFDEPPGSYVICEVCGWEDDPVQLRHPAMSGGANKLSLSAHQQAALLKVPAHAQMAKGYRRAPGWRPLLPEEVSSANVPNSGASYFQAAAEESPGYYWSRDVQP